jgi:CHAT domain-containing protein
MAAFVEGTLRHDERSAVSDHLRDCGDCRTVVGETARSEREEAAGPRMTQAWWLAAAAVVAATAVTIPLLRRTGSDAGPMAPLLAAAPRDHRLLEARLTAFPWARLQAPSRGDAAPSPADLQLDGAAGEVLEKTLASTDAEARRATGVAYLVIGRHRESLAALAGAAASSNDASVWNDLAAARYEVALHGQPSELPQALAEADRALRLDGRSAAGRFNRALIVERMGLREEARAAWLRFLDVEPGSEWSTEARQHVRRLSDGLLVFDPALLDTMLPDELARQFPLELRTRGEGLLLAEWADAEAAGDAARAAGTLNRVRQFGDALRRARGEQLLADAVVAIDRAGAPARRLLAMAHRTYRDGRVALKQRQPRAAEAQFKSAAEAFAAGGSPMAPVTRYYEAIAAFNQGHVDEASAALLELLGTVDSTRHPALAAQLHWQLATCANAAADWGAAARHADASATLFRALGESANAAFVDSLAAMALELIGETGPAWEHRLRSFTELSTHGERARLATLVHSAAFTLGSTGKPAAAAAMLDLLIEPGRVEPAQLSFVLADRARLAARLDDDGDARRAFGNARAAAAKVLDPALREIVDAQIGLAQASLPRGEQPAVAIAVLDRSIAVFTRNRTKADLADAYLQRARAYRADGDPAAAALDLAAALHEVELQQSTIGDEQSRLQFLDTAAQILEETIELRLAQGDVAGAFRMADRSRTLLERRGAQTLSSTETVDLIPSVAPGMVLVEYAVLPRSVIAFCVTSDGITAERIDVDRATLQTRIATFVDRIRRRAPVAEVDAEGTALYRLLIESLQPRLSGARELVIVPDRQLYALPFAALRDEARQKYLAEKLVLRFATAATFAEDPGGALRPALIVADPPAAQWPRLEASREEAARIAALHQGTLLSGAAATRRAFADAAAGSALIHFAGHADSDATASYGALLFAASAADSGIVGSSDVARIRLTRRPLVVLAACGTFRGDALHVGGMSSLARAFLAAGARGVVGTLWEIDDDVSAPLFLRLHQHLIGGAAPADALRSAQSDLLHSADPRLAHPATWAPVEYLTMSNRSK